MAQRPSVRAGGRWVRGGVAVVVVAVLGFVSYCSVIRPIQRNAANPDPVDPSQAPPAAASLAGPGNAPGPRTKGGNAPPPESGEAMPEGDLPGWRQVFTDDFDRSSLGTQWDAYTGQPDGDPGGYFDPSHVWVDGGVLTIGASRDPARGGIYVTGGISNRHTVAATYGRYDIRYRMEPGRGIAYALLLWPKNNDYPPEIDIAEDRGQDRRTMYGTVHPAGRGPIQHQVEGDFTQWHTAGVEWTPDGVKFTLDGRAWANIGPPAVPDEPMALALQTQSWYCGHTWEACPDSSTPTEVNLYVDWVVGYLRDE